MGETGNLLGLLLLFAACFEITASTATVEEVKAHVGDTVALPCRVDTSQCGDLHSVKWYRETSRIYVFSQVGGIARAEGDATERMSVEYTPPGSEALLKISPVEVLDEASYKCEITYLEVRENCDVVQIIKLTTLVRPESVRILGVDGVSMGNASMLGPFDEGTQIELICEANAGRPTPKVSWYNGTKPLKALYSSHEDGDGLGTGTSKLQFPLSRGDLGTKFECRVESEALEQPIVSWMTADVNVKPTKIELSGVKSHVVQGTHVLLICDVFGARPAAEVRWFNNSDPITDETIMLTVPDKMRDGTFTTKSSLTFLASRFENGNAFHCYADNPVMREQKEPPLHEVILLEVFYPPVVTVSPANITTNEGGDILILCNYISNPMKLDGVVWAKNGENLSLKEGKYDGGVVDNPPLIIKNVSREDIGEYSCTCKNSVGSEMSNGSVFLNVLYPPSVEISLDPPTPVKERDQTNVTLLCSVTSGNPPDLAKVRWYFRGYLLKELPYCNFTDAEDEVEDGSGGELCGIDPSLLGLWTVGQSMADNYTCQGMNVAGWGPESNPSELVVYYPPSPAKLRFTPSKVIKRASVTLDCSVSNPGRPENITYLWYRGTYQVPDVTTSNWTISPVLLETKSNFTCIAMNEGGQSSPATVFIDVSAPPAFIQNLPPYQGVLMSAKNISLTCRVECSPLCSLTWFKDGHPLNVNNNPLYYVKTAVYPPDLRKNDFESIESTLVWNMTAWPGEMLDRTAPNSNYTCQSSANGIGPGVNSTIEIAVDYPPENLTVSNAVVHVMENHKPEKVSCSGKGHPALSYVWRRDGSNDPLSKSHILQLGAVPRSASGNYICEATNRHGKESIHIYLNVKYAPSCTIEPVEYEGGSALECTAHANPQEVTFTWRIKGENDTVEGGSLVQKGLKGYLVLDSSVDSFRTYQCYVNNTVGISSPCERDVTGVAPWWRQFTNENLLILIAVIVGIIICVIIICIIIIIVCKRKRANNKYTNAVEMEEREKPDGQSPDTSGSKWPLKPGVLVHVNKMHNLNMSQLSPMSLSACRQFKTTSVSHRRGKVYARLERFKELLGFGDRDSLPFGVYRGSAGVVTFKKFKDASSPTQSERVPVSRKRKKPGLPPNQSSTADKGRSGAAQPGGGSADPLTDPDKGFYENLPFHGMQNPPNKPISVISPTIQDGRPFASSTKSLVSLSCNDKKVQRNQSFHGFVAYPWPVIYNVPQTNPFSYCGRVQSFAALNSTNPFSPQARVAGRNEHRVDIRRTASGINLGREDEKRFNSLEVKKHRCYSPTFYSWRCKKHAKKRPIIYTIPKKPKNDNNEQFQDLTDSIQIFEQGTSEETPKPAPRCSKHKDIVYANVSSSIVSEALVHKKDDSLVASEAVSKVDHKKEDSGVSPKFDPTNKFVPYKKVDSEGTSKVAKVDPTPKVAKLEPKAPNHKNERSFSEAKAINPSPKGALFVQLQAKLRNNDAATTPLTLSSSALVQKALSQTSLNRSTGSLDKVGGAVVKEEANGEAVVPRMPLLDGKWSSPSKNSFYTLTTPHLKQLTPSTAMHHQYSATIPHQKHPKLLPRSLFQEQQQISKSKSFSSKSKPKKHFQIPLQKCHSFKFQTAESYFQPIKNIHEENFMRNNGYMSDLGANYPDSTSRHHKKKNKNECGPLVLRRPPTGDYHENVQFQENVQNSVRLQYPQPVLGRTSRTNGVVYADLDMPKGGKKCASKEGCASLTKSQKKPKTEYATLQFNDVGQEIDV